MANVPDTSPQEKAATLRTLHVAGDPLVLPNAWDAASARMVETAGFPVVATSSFATAAILGYADGEAAPVEEVLAAAARIVRAVSVPVTVDFERGYGLAPAELVERFAATGAVGLNLEDSTPATGDDRPRRASGPRVSFGATLQLHLYNQLGSTLLSAVAAGENPFAS